MKLNIYVPRAKEDSKCWNVFDPFRTGWNDNHEIVHDYPPVREGVGMFWGFVGKNEAAIRQHIHLGIPWMFSDMPYFGRWNGLTEALNPSQEFHWRIIKNSCHVTGIGRTRPSDRWEHHNIKLKPWKRNGSEILICPSSETMTKFHTSLNVDQWVSETIIKIQRHTDRPIRVRYKPRGNGTSGPAAALIPFEDDIKDAWAVVTCVSMAGVEAIIHGVPVINTDHNSPVATMGNMLINQCVMNPIEYITYLDREPLLYKLAYSQFTPKEMASGYAREILGY